MEHKSLASAAQKVLAVCRHAVSEGGHESVFISCVMLSKTDCVYASVEDHDTLQQVGSAVAQTRVPTPEALQQLGVHHIPVHLNGHIELQHHKNVSMAHTSSTISLRRVRRAIS